MDSYKYLIAYKLSQIAFDLGWDFVPKFYNLKEDGRQRDQIKQALRSLKQNIVEGTSERSLSSKLKLYDVARASLNEAKEDFEDIIRQKSLATWNKNDPRLVKLRSVIESSATSNTSFTSTSSVLKTLGMQEVLGVKDGIEVVVNYERDLLIRCGYFLDKLINSVEEEHKTKGGYTENLRNKRVAYIKLHGK